MMYKAKVAVCSQIRTKHSTQSEHHVEFFECYTWWYVKKPLGFKWLIIGWFQICLRIISGTLLLWA